MRSIVLITLTLLGSTLTSGCEPCLGSHTQMSFVVAEKDLEPGQTLKRQDYTAAERCVPFTPAGGPLTPETASEYHGKVLESGVRRGEIITLKDFGLWETPSNVVF